MKQNGGNNGVWEHAAAASLGDVHRWEEEAPQAQLNGGSDPVVITATHAVYHGHGGCTDTIDDGVENGVWGCGGASADGPREAAGRLSNPSRSDFTEKNRPDDRGREREKLASHDGACEGSGGRKGGAVMLRIRAYNATNARLHGFVIRLSFGPGAEPVGMENGGRVETCVDEVRAGVLNSPVS